MATATNSASLLIVDLQEGFVTPRNQHVIGRVEQLQEAYQYVYASKFILDTDDQNRRMGRQNLAFTPRDEARIFEKSTHSAATAEIIEDLRSKGVRQVHVCGIETNVCALATTVALLDEDFYVAVRPEAWASNSTKYDWDEDRFHETALMVMKNMGIRTWGC